MNEGKELLQEIIEDKLKSLQIINREEIIIDNINLADLLTNLENENDNFCDVTDSIIDTVIPYCKVKKNASFRKKIIQIRDLLIGKRDYRLNINMSNENKELMQTFIQGLRNTLDNKAPGVGNIDITEKNCYTIIRKMNTKEIITDFAFIEKLVKEYNEIEFDNNMVIIMNYINKHNLTILKTPKRNAPIFDIKYIIKPRLDERIKEILNRLEIEYKELPNYLIGELKKCNVDEIYETYQLIKKNKAEDYGILHLINKENVLLKLITILYATPNSIKTLVDSIRDNQGQIDINLLKIIINYIPNSLLAKSNIYFKNKNEDFNNNMNLLKELGINYRAVISRTPTLMITSHEVLTYTLNYLEQLGGAKKQIINKCYKTLTINPATLIENANILKKHNIDMQEYFKEETNNYNLLKVENLEMKLNILIKKYNLNTKNLNADMLNKYLIATIYRNATSGKKIWSEEND